MLHRYGNVSGRLPETAAEAFAAGVTPTFQQFITYLLDPETEKQSVFNEHWRQVCFSFLDRPLLVIRGKITSYGSVDESVDYPEPSTLY